MKKAIYFTIIIGISAIVLQNVLAEEDLASKLSGKILLQVEENGEAWYIEPEKNEKYFLNRPADAFDIMRKFGVGITNTDLAKIQIGLIDNDNIDTDNDGLSNDLEIAIGTNSEVADSDNDGYTDKEEILSGYNPMSTNETLTNYSFYEEQKGKILLQVEKNGEAWYVNPENSKRYFLGRPVDAFNIMKNLGLGISNENLFKIPSGYVYKEPIIIPEPEITTFSDPAKAIENAAEAIRKNNIKLALSSFTENMYTLVEYTMNFLNSEQRLMLGNILSDTHLTESTENKKTYSTEIYFNGEKHTINFNVEKQEDDNWLLTNL